MQQLKNPQSGENPNRESRRRSKSLAEKFAILDEYYRNGGRLFRDESDDGCLSDGENDDDAECNYHNCC